MIQFEIAGMPHAQQRARASTNLKLKCRCGRVWEYYMRPDKCTHCGASAGTIKIIGKGRTIIRDPKKSRAWKSVIRTQAVNAQKVSGITELITGNVFMIDIYNFLKPKSEKASVVYRHKRPDIDNLVKGIMDGVKGVIWKDDVQLVSHCPLKIYAGNLTGLFEIDWGMPKSLIRIYDNFNEYALDVIEVFKLLATIEHTLFTKVKNQLTLN